MNLSDLTERQCAYLWALDLRQEWITYRTSPIPLQTLEKKGLAESGDASSPGVQKSFLPMLAYKLTQAGKKLVKENYDTLCKEYGSK